MRVTVKQAGCPDAVVEVLQQARVAALKATLACERSCSTSSPVGLLFRGRVMMDNELVGAALGGGDHLTDAVVHAVPLVTAAAAAGAASATVHTHTHQTLTQDGLCRAYLSLPMQPSAGMSMSPRAILAHLEQEIARAQECTTSFDAHSSALVVDDGNADHDGYDSVEGENEVAMSDASAGRSTPHHACGSTNSQSKEEKDKEKEGGADESPTNAPQRDEVGAPGGLEDVQGDTTAEEGDAGAVAAPSFWRSACANFCTHTHTATKLDTH